MWGGVVVGCGMVVVGLLGVWPRCGRMLYDSPVVVGVFGVVCLLRPVRQFLSVGDRVGFVGLRVHNVARLG